MRFDTSLDFQDYRRMEDTLSRIWLKKNSEISFQNVNTFLKMACTYKDLFLPQVYLLCNSFLFIRY
jgi:hypothetical protein